MKPDVAQLIDVAAAHLMVGIAPKLGPGYEQSSMLVLMTLLTSVREEFERAASRRVEENRELRELFGAAAPRVEDSALRARLEEASTAQDASFAISDLESGNADLRQLLIDLHAHIETLATADAREIEERIWRELARSTERRQLSIAPY